MSDHKTDTATPAVVDVKHYVIDKDEAGNEIRVEVTAEEVAKEFPVK